MNLALLIALCAPAIDPSTARAVVLHESGGNPYAIHINGGGRLSRQPDSFAQAVATAGALVRKGYSIDVGLAQINSRNLPRLGLSVAQVFNPCVNLQAMQAILVPDYLQQVQRLGPGQQALQAALSEYNTGNPVSGFANGYVASVYRVAFRRQ